MKVIEIPYLKKVVSLKNNFNKNFRIFFSFKFIKILLIKPGKLSVLII